MTRLLTGKKTSSRKPFLIMDQGNLVKIKGTAAKTFKKVTSSNFNFS